MSDWFEDETFWRNLSPVLFTKDVIKTADKDVDNIIRLLSLKPGSAIVDLACGIGRHSVAFAKRGFKVTGVDRNAAFIEQARERVRAANVDVEFIQKDMREFSRKAAFDAAVLLWHSFSFLEKESDILKTLRNISNSLKKNGRLVIQTLSKEHIARRSRRGGRDWFEKNGHLELIERRISPDWSTEETRVILIADNARKEMVFTTRLYSGVEMLDILAESGFHDCDLYSDLYGAPYNALTGQHHEYQGELVAVATK